MDLMQIIKDRRSVRKFKADPVPDEFIDSILQAGQWAPSWANTQCWRFIVIRDTEIKEKLAETKGKGNPAGDAIKYAPVVIAICAELKQSGYYKGEAPTIKGDWYMFDTALAAQNMMLMIHDLRLGTVPVGLFDSARVEQILQLPESMTIVILLPIGYPDEEPKAPKRKEIGEIAFHNTFGSH